MKTPLPLLRLDRLLASLGYATRSTVRSLLASGRISIGDEIITDGARKARATEIFLDGTPLDHPEGIFIILNKPAGYVCSHEAGEGQLIYDLLPDHWRHRNPVPTSIGRLDKDTTGILLVTDRMPLVHALTSPKRDIDKVYLATVDGPLEEKLVERFASGRIRLDNDEKPCRPALLKILDSRTAEVTLHEGRYHQVKRMFAACGLTVTALHRSRFAEYTLGDLAPGAWRDLPFPD